MTAVSRGASIWFAVLALSLGACSDPDCPPGFILDGRACQRENAQSMQDAAMREGESRGGRSGGGDEAGHLADPPEKQRDGSPPESASDAGPEMSPRNDSANASANDARHGDNAGGTERIGMSKPRDDAGERMSDAPAMQPPPAPSEPPAKLPAGANCQDIANGLLALWHGENDYADVTGKNQATSAGAVSFSDGVVGRAFNLNGAAGAYLTAENSPSLAATQALTLDVWVKASQVTGRIIDKVTANTVDGYLLDIVDNDHIRFSMRGYDAVSPYPFEAGKFTHLAGVFTGPSVELYMNGIRVAANPAMRVPTFVNQLPVHIGADADGKNLFVGLIDEPRIFGRALSAQEIQTLYQQGSPAHCGCAPSPTDLVSWWPAEGDAKDAYGFNPGTAAPSVTYAPAAVGSGFVFSGAAGSYVEVPHSQSLDFRGALSVEAWVRPQALRGRIVDKVMANTISGFLLDILDEKLRLMIGPDSAVSRDDVVLPTNTFLHVAGVFDGAKVSVYVDGEEAGSKAAQNASVPPNALSLRIGADSEGENRFAGTIDEVRLYRRALRAAEVREIYQAGASARCR